MAIIEHGGRLFQRKQDGLLIYLTMTDWPTDIPLPNGTRLGGRKALPVACLGDVKIFSPS